MIRSDESPRYWDSGGLAAVVRLGNAVGHGHKDHFHMILHGKGRLLYPDLNVIQYEPTYLHWTHEGIAHNTLLVDQKSPRPGAFTTRKDFAPEAKFFALSGSAFEGVRQTRALVMTGDYLADVFRAADAAGEERTFDWVLHGLGRLYPGNPGAYRPTQALVPGHWWVDNERGRKTDSAWQADWVQRSAGVAPGVQRFGKEWFAQTVGVRLTMLGAPGSEVYVGDGPLVDGPPHHRIEGNREGSSPLVVVRRRAPATTFAAVHEPYDRRSTLRAVRRIGETDAGIGVAVDSAAFSDRVLIAYRADKEQTRRGAGGEAFTFRDHGYLRVTTGGVVVRGTVTAFRVRAKSDRLAVNGKKQAGRRKGEFLVFGSLPDDKGKARVKAEEADPREHRATLHYSFEPEEVHLRAGGEKEAALYVRCVGPGEARGSLRLASPKGIRVVPEKVDLGRLREGDEKVVRLRVKADAGAANGLHELRCQPEGKTPAAAGKLLVSVGVVITEDKRVPLLAQSIIRAPGYTMKVDQLSGVSYYLLDADGNRRHGRLYGARTGYGIPGIERGGKWLLRYRMPCRFVWEAKDTLTVGSGREAALRLRYTFHEDRIVLGFAPPTNPTLGQTMWLGGFEGLLAPQHNGVRKKPRDPLTVDWLFFPHPRHRQGLLVVLPKKTPVEVVGDGVGFPLRRGQEAVLRFAAKKELPKLVKVPDEAKGR
jgi:hypothetical protein